jgi:hypothetical protein
VLSFFSFLVSRNKTQASSQVSPAFFLTRNATPPAGDLFGGCAVWNTFNGFTGARGQSSWLHAYGLPLLVDVLGSAPQSLMPHCALCSSVPLPVKLPIAGRARLPGPTPAPQTIPPQIPAMQMLTEEVRFRLTRLVRLHYSRIGSFRERTGSGQPGSDSYDQIPPDWILSTLIVQTQSCTGDISYSIGE